MEMTIERISDGKLARGAEGPVPDGFRRVQDPPLGPHKYLGSSGQPVESPTPYDPKADPFTTRPAGMRSGIDALLNPRGISEHIASFGAQAPLIGGAAALSPMVGIPPTLGAAGMSGLLGAASALKRGDSPTWQAGTEVATSLAGSGILKAIPHIGWGDDMIRSLTRRVSAVDTFDRAKRLVGEAFDAVKNRLGVPDLSIPSLSARPIPVADVANKLKGLRAEKYHVGVEETRRALNAADVSGHPLPAGDAFVMGISKDLFDPPKGSIRAREVVQSLRSPMAKGSASAALGQQEEGVPLAIPAVLEGLDMARHPFETLNLLGRQFMK